MAVLRTAFRGNDFSLAGLGPSKTFIAAIRKYWHNHRLVNLLGTKSINAETDAP